MKFIAEEKGNGVQVTAETNGNEIQTAFFYSYVIKGATASLAKYLSSNKLGKACFYAALRTAFGDAITIRTSDMLFEKLCNEPLQKAPIKEEKKHEEPEEQQKCPDWVAEMLKSMWR